jgi:hypothetical protein
MKLCCNKGLLKCGKGCWRCCAQFPKKQLWSFMFILVEKMSSWMDLQYCSFLLWNDVYRFGNVLFFQFIHPFSSKGRQSLSYRNTHQKQKEKNLSKMYNINNNKIRNNYNFNTRMHFSYNLSFITILHNFNLDS